MKKCDIVIPIYNAYTALCECVSSIIKNTDLKENTLILIDDCSTDENIGKYINKVKKDNKDLNIVIIKNKDNLGFVKTVNKGMKYSKNDVLLLNSDTVVGKNWLDKIKKCAYREDKIATVTPLSNNATLASVPIGLQKNEIPEDISIDEYNELIEKCSYHEYPEVPTSHGFCVYIKRSVLDEVGYFDEESYGRGYGEENDFSFRCIDYGYKNVLCDDVIVYHKESQSFSDEKQKVIDSHLNILSNKYPKYFWYLSKWCEEFPIKHIGKNIGYYMNVSKRKNILVLIHDWTNLTGGTTLHVMDIVNNLRNKFNFHILYPQPENYVLKSYFEDYEDEILLKNVNRISEFSKYNNKYKEMLEDIVLAMNIDFVHIQHMIGHFFDIVDVCEKYKINKIITLHDFYCLCPNYNLLYCNDKFCLNMNKPDHSKCLKELNGLNNNIIPSWREDWYSFLKRMDTIIVPSNNTKNYILKQYKELDISVIEHGVDISKNYENIIIDKKFNVAYIGCVLKHKGGFIFRDLVKQSKSKNIKYHIFGLDMIGGLDFKKKNFKFHGKYDRDKLNELLIKNNINLICFFQIWPETYSYTLNEAISAGIPVLSFDMGAGAEKVRKNKLGWVIPVDSTPKYIEDKILSIQNNKEEYNKVVKNIKSYKNKSLSKMIDEYDKIYSKKSNKNIDMDVEVLKKIMLPISSTSSINYKEKYEEILNSTKWRLVNKIKFRPWFISLVRKIMKKENN